MQMPAPLDGQEAVATTERVLYVYGCASPGCGRHPGSWRAFRCQLQQAADIPGVAAKPPADPAATTPDSSPAGAWEGGGSWSAADPSSEAGPHASVADCTRGGAGAWGGSGTSVKPTDKARLHASGVVSAAADPCGPGGSDADAWAGGGGWESGLADAPDAFDLSDIDAALTALAAATRPAAREKQPKRRGAEQAPPGGSSRGAEAEGLRPGFAAAPSCPAPSDQPSLPGFHLHAEAEPAAAGSKLSAREAEHIAALLAEYERSSPASAGKAGKEGPAVGAAPAETWAGEAYERTAPPGAAAAFHK